MASVPGSLSLLARLTGVDIAFGEGMNTGKPVISSDQFHGFGDAMMSDKRGVMAFSQDIHTQGKWRFRNVNKALVEE